MEIHQLRYMINLAKCLHFSKAALELGITQPTLSQQIERLEKELGCRLFERRTRSVELTLAGEEFLLHAKKVLAELALLGEAMQSHAAAKKNYLRIGTFANLTRFKLAKYFLEFERIHPHIKLHPVEKVGSCELSELLRSGQLDAALLMPEPTLSLPPSTICRTLIPGELVVVAKSSHPLSQAGAVSLRDIAKERLIFPSRTLSSYGAMLNAFRAEGVIPNIACESNLTDSAIDLVAQGFGIALISSPFADAAAHPDIAFLSLTPKIERDIAFVYQSPNAHAPILQTFCEFLERKKLHLAAPYPIA